MNLCFSPAVAKQQNDSPLVTAAAALDAELRRHEELSGDARKIPLNSEKNLQRAARAISQAAESQERVSRCVQALVDAVGQARDKQQSNADALYQRALEMQKRAAELQELMKRFAELGAEATTINDLLQAAGDDQAARVKSLEEAEARMTKVVDGASALANDAKERDMQDIARQADSLRQQVLAVKEKVERLQKSSTNGTTH
jgi:chromosome segregation ATPase